MMSKDLNVICDMIDNRGWTPGRRDIADLFAMWQSLDDDRREIMKKRLANIDAPSVARSISLLPNLDTRTRGDLVRPLLKAYCKSQGKGVVDWLDFPKSCLQDSDARVRKSAIQALGASWESVPTVCKVLVVDLMIDGLRKATDSSERKALVDALGKSGLAQAKAALDGLGDIGTSRAILILERDLARTVPVASEGELDPSGLRGLGFVCWFTNGLEHLARRGGIFLGADVKQPGVLTASRDVTWKDLCSNGLWREAGVVIAMNVDGSPQELAKILAAKGADIRRSTGLSDDGKVRIRLGRSLGRSRSFIWEFAVACSAERSGMINDGRAPHWEVRVLGRDAVLVPVGWKDHRFSWRDTAVEGASDPTIATALVEVADIKSNDSIWDPFCGGGTELIIAKKRFPSLVTLGTDINPSAVLAAQAAADRCQVSAKFLSKNCFDVQGQKFDVILTNPPFGMRTVRGGARPLLEDFFVQASRSLKAGGRFVIMSHAPSTSLRWAGASGLACQRQIPVKLGGMDCQIQVFVPRN